ncbi:response regulator transcription factor [Subtercola sp. YIM 133946]|uniref:response regulator transcription factor n=1 Tax=Subtercola sp. YIM 133946 TaxID=3118909 RepID=UPI002F92DC0F
MPDKIRVLLIDDHPMIIDGLTLALETDDIEVVAAAGTVSEARRLATEISVDVVVLDLHLPDGSGLSLIPFPASGGRVPAIVVLTLAEDQRLVSRALLAGASGYLVKGASREEIVATIRAVARGQIVLGSTIARRGIESFGSSGRFPQLTEREEEVLALVADGRDNPAIGRQLGISAKTVANHVSSILLKLGAADRSQAAIMALRAGVIPPGSSAL